MPQLLDILRHAIAEDRRPNLPDAQREITADGRKKLKQVLARARHAGVSPSLVLTSPLVRAVQTAEMAATELKCRKLVQTSCLAPGIAPEKTLEEIAKYSKMDEIMIVGHEPHLSRFAAHILGAPALAIDFKKAGMMQVSQDAGHTILEWLLTPKLCK